jgi:hypothetical protein
VPGVGDGGGTHAQRKALKAWRHGGTAKILHLVMAERAKAQVVTRDAAQADFARRIGMSDVRLLTSKGKKAPGANAEGGDES